MLYYTWITHATVLQLLSPVEYKQYHRQRVDTQLPTQPSERIGAAPLNQAPLRLQSTLPIVHQPSPSVTAVIAPRLSKLIRSSKDKVLGRTCRLVCRDWVKQFPVRESKNFNWRLEDGVVWHWIEAAWRVLPITSWAWTLACFSDEWWVEPGGRHQWFTKVIAV